MTSFVLDLGELGEWPSLNSLGHWSALRPKIKNVRDVAWGEARRARLPRGLGPVEIELVLHLVDSQRQDPDNLGLVLKAAIDGLRMARVLNDDGHSHVVRAGCRIVPADPPRRWVLHITERTEPEAA